MHAKNLPSKSIKSPPDILNLPTISFYLLCPGINQDIPFPYPLLTTVMPIVSVPCVVTDHCFYDFSIDLILSGKSHPPYFYYYFHVIQTYVLFFFKCLYVCLIATLD